MFNTKSFIAAAATFSLIAFSTATYDLNSKSNVVVYWGSGSNQQELKHFCEQPEIDVINLGFMNVFPAQGNGYPAVDFGNACSADPVYVGPGTDHTKDKLYQRCRSVQRDIPYCQANGKKIVLSLGGGTNTYQLTGEIEGTDFANFLWQAYGPYKSSYTGIRPLDRGYDNDNAYEHIDIDGFDFDIEVKSTDLGVGYIAMINRLRQLFLENPAKQYLITGSPQCPFPDGNMKEMINGAQFDALYIQFYNNPACSAGNWATNYNAGGTGDNGFNYDQWASSFLGASANAKLYIGLSASPSSSSYPTDYLSPKNAAIMLPIFQTHARFGGVMLWEATSADENLNSAGQGYQKIIKKALAPNDAIVTPAFVTPLFGPPSTTSTTSTATSTTTTSVSTTSSSTQSSSSSSSATGSSITQSTTTTSSSSSSSTSACACTTGRISPTPASAICNAEAPNYTGTPDRIVTSVYSDQICSASCLFDSSCVTYVYGRYIIGYTVGGNLYTAATYVCELFYTPGNYLSNVALPGNILAANYYQSDRTCFGCIYPDGCLSSSTSASITTSLPTSSSSTVQATSTSSSSTSSPITVSSSASSSTSTSSSSQSSSASTSISSFSTSTSTSGSTSTHTITSTSSISTLSGQVSTSISGNSASLSTSTVSSKSTSGPITSAPSTGSTTGIQTIGSVTGNDSVSFTTSTIQTTVVRTVTSCAPTVTDCPVGPHVTTEVIDLYVTICPVTAAAAAPTAVAASSTAFTTSTVQTTIIRTVTSCAPTVTNCPVGPHVTTEIIDLYVTICPVTAASGTKPTVILGSTSAPAAPVSTVKPLVSSFAAIFVQNSVESTSTKTSSQTAYVTVKVLSTTVGGNTASTSKPIVATSSNVESVVSVYSTIIVSPTRTLMTSTSSVITSSSVVATPTATPARGAGIKNTGSIAGLIVGGIVSLWLLI